MTSADVQPLPRPIATVLAQVAARPEALAALRRGVGRPLEEAPESWPYVIEVAGGVRWKEEAAHLTLGLFALHHQSQSPGSMNTTGWGLGRACRNLKRTRGAAGSSEEGVERRFRAALGSDTPETLSVHLRGLVTMLRGASVPLDYPRLYRELSSWKYPEQRERICLAWAREYFMTPSDNEAEGET